jgi:hypothetical protein
MPLSNRELEHFMNQCRIKLPGASDSGIKTEFYEVCKEFLADSNAWVEHIQLPVVVGVQDYPLVPQHGGQIVSLVGVWDGNRLPVTAFMEQFGEVHIRWPIQQTSIAIPPGTPITTLSAANPFLAVVIKNVDLPTSREDFPVVPEFLLRVYSVHITDGVLGKMMQQQNKSYSNDAKSLYHLRRFRTGIQIAKTAAARKNTKGAQTWSYPRGWGANTQRGGMVTAWPAETF